MNNSFSAMDENNGESRMKKVTLSEATREKVEEATLAVFMEQYGAALDAGVEIKMAECADMEFPPELDKRIQKLIADAQVEKKKKQRRKTALRVLRSAAAVLIVLLSVSSILFMTVEAVRIPIINFFVEKTDLYWEISTSKNEPELLDAFNEENPLERILSNDYTLVNIDGSLSEYSLIADYKKSTGETVSLLVISIGGNNQIDTEHADVSEFFLMGHEAVLSVEGSDIRITWINHDISKVFTVRTTNLSSDEAITISEKTALFFE